MLDAALEFFTELEGSVSTLATLATLPTLIVWADADQIFTDKHRARCGAEFCDAIASSRAELAES